MGWFRSDLRNVVDLLERDSADHLLARRLCALLHSRLRSKAVSRRMAAARNVEGGWQAAAGSQAVVTKPGDKKPRVGLGQGQGRDRLRLHTLLCVF